MCRDAFACFSSLITWAKIALSVSISVASSLICCIFKIIHIFIHNMWYFKNYRFIFGLLMIVTMELFLDSTLAWDPTFIKYPMVQYLNWFPDCFLYKICTVHIHLKTLPFVTIYLWHHSKFRFWPAQSNTEFW